MGTSSGQTNNQLHQLAPFHHLNLIQSFQIPINYKSRFSMPDNKYYFSFMRILSPFSQHKLLLYCLANNNFMKELRESILADEELVASKRRFGLFSQPPPIAIGDDSAFPSKIAKKGEDGKPITLPRNMLAGPNRSGVDKKGFIHVPESIYQKDPYSDTFKKELEYERKMHSKSQMHEANFKPASGSKTLASSAYGYVEEKQNTQKKVRKDDNGRVKTQPANVQTNPTSKVETKLFKHAGYMTDPYDRPQQIQKQQKQIWKSKIKHETMFKTMSHGNSVFTKDKSQYGLDQKAQSIASRKTNQSMGNYKRVNHQTKFKLARRGFGDPIGRYPEYTAPKDKGEVSQSMRAKTQKSEGERQNWKPAACTLSRPTPSVSLMMTNMRKCM